MRFFVALVLACGCGPKPPPSAALRIGFFPNVTHAAALIALERGEWKKRFGAVETRTFNAGPEAMEALFAGALDAAYVGAGPALTAWAASDGQATVIVAGSASGGAALVVAKDSGITGPESLHGKRLATPQLGNTQDVALRHWLASNGLATNDRGGDVYVMPMANPDILNLFRGGRLDGAWVPEPWVARLRHEAGGRVLIDEKTLWPDGKYPTTVLVVRRKLAVERPHVVEELVAAHVAAIRWAHAHPVEARATVDTVLTRLLRQRLPPAVLSDALAHVELTWEPLPEALAEEARRARQLGYLRTDRDPREAIDRRFLDAVVKRGE